jgi:hypothetical protein
MAAGSIGTPVGSGHASLAKAIAIVSLALGTVVALVTGAIFTSTASVGSNTFSTGTVILGTSPSSALVTFSAMAPGDQVTAPITVSNTGSMQLRYAVKGTTTEDVLAAQLALTIKTGVTTCTNGGFDSSGTVIYGPGVVGSTAGTNLVGDPTQGAQSGDRTLGASSSETLCFHVSLPLSTGNSSQGLSSTATFDFIGEQTANN